MASAQLFIMLIVVVVTAVLPTVTPFQRYLVGDWNGWTTGVDYETWAKGYEFHVGDQLKFLYDRDKHNVYKVNETRFDNCLVPPEAEALTGGNNGVFLTKPGKHWFLCGVDLHCKNGMKVAITVLSDQVGSPPPLNRATPSPSSAHDIVKSWIGVFIVTVVTYSIYVII